MMGVRWGVMRLLYHWMNWNLHSCKIIFSFHKGWRLSNYRWIFQNILHNVRHLHCPRSWSSYPQGSRRFLATLTSRIPALLGGDAGLTDDRIYHFKHSRKLQYKFLGIVPFWGTSQAFSFFSCHRYADHTVDFSSTCADFNLRLTVNQILKHRVCYDVFPCISIVFK